MPEVSDVSSIAGARLQSLVFRKYVLGLGWRILMKPDGSVDVQASSDRKLGAAQASCDAVLAQLDSLVDCLEVTTPLNTVSNQFVSMYYQWHNACCICTSTLQTAWR